MPAQHTLVNGTDLDSARKVLRAAMHVMGQPERAAAQYHSPVFVTVSRQSGAGGSTFSHRLAHRLNQRHPGARDVWSAWDQELIEKVSSEEGIARQIVAEIENRPQTWLEEMLESFSSSPTIQHTPEFRVYRRIAAAIRALAGNGHAIIVGQGGRWVTEKLIGGVHIRLVAPVSYRIQNTTEQYHLSPAAAAQRIEEVDYHRAKFFSRYWPGKHLAPEAFTMTLNVSELSVGELVECALPAILAKESARYTTSTAGVA